MDGTKILRINMKDLKIAYEDSLPQWETLGGRGLTSSIIAREVNPVIHPLERENKLVLAVGLLSGTSAPCSGRLSIGAKSPLTDGIKESNVGGTSAFALARLGVKAIIIEDAPVNNKSYLIKINKDGARIIPADDLLDSGTYQLTEQIREKYGKKVSVISVGPASRLKMATASIAVTDIDGFPTRQAARGGLGSVMAGKGLKAIVINPREALGPEIKYKNAFLNGRRKLVKALQEHPITSISLPTYGTSILITLLNEAGALASYNFTQGKFEQADKISAETIYENCISRGGKTSHPCLPGCTIRCSNIYKDKSGNPLTSGLNFDTIWAFGANCGVSDLDKIALMNRLCNNIGVDSIEIGIALGMAMSAGVLNFGDADKMIQIIREIGKGTHLGRIIASGAEVAGKILGTTRVPAVKKQGIPAYDPRAIKGMGVTYLTSPMGADYTAGYTVASSIMGLGEKVDPLNSKEQIELSNFYQVYTSAFDCTGLCLFVGLALLDNLAGVDGLLEMINARYGWEMTYNDALKLGQKILNIERDFNFRAGIPTTSNLPKFFKEEPLPPHNTVFDLNSEKLTFK